MMFALIVGLVLPAAASASSGSFGVTVLKNACTSSGGAYGYGKNVLSLQLWEKGRSGVAQFHARAIEQVNSGGTWHSVYDWGWSATNFFGDNAKNHSWTYGPRYDFGASDLGHHHRMVVKMIFGNGTAYPVATPKRISIAC